MNFDGISSGDRALAEALLRANILSPKQLERSLQVHRSTGAVLAFILDAQGHINERELVSFLAEEARVPLIELAQYKVKEAAFEHISKDFCDKYSVAPIEVLGNVLTIAVPNPLDSETIRHVEQECPNFRLKTVVCGWTEIRALLRTKSNSQDPDEAPAAVPPSNPEQFLEMIEGRISRASQHAISEIVTDIDRYMARHEGKLPLAAGDLVAAVRGCMSEAIDDIAGTLLFEIQRSLEGAKSGDDSPQDTGSATHSAETREQPPKQSSVTSAKMRS